MPIVPNIEKPIGMKKCARCGKTKSINEFAFSHSEFWEDKHIPWCHTCATSFLKNHEFSWEAIDKLCQWSDIPFIVKEWERLRLVNNEDEIWKVYSQVFNGEEYASLGWDSYFKQYKKLKEVGLIEEELPMIREQKYNKLRRNWGENYDESELNYLEDLYNGLLSTQNVVGPLQEDQARKVCKLSLEIDSRIRAGDKEVDKFVSTYDRLIKAADFTPKNTKNATDFDSVAELAHWLEKRGKQNKFYDGATRDVIDETLKNIENFNQRLYVNEGGIGEEITNRLKALNSVEEESNFYGIQQDFDADEYDNAGFIMDVDEEFLAGGME